MKPLSSKTAASSSSWFVAKRQSAVVGDDGREIVSHSHGFGLGKLVFEQGPVISLGDAFPKRLNVRVGERSSR